MDAHMCFKYMLTVIQIHILFSLTTIVILISAKVFTQF